MATVEERLRVLKLLEAGKISVSEAEKLLAALGAGRKPPPARSARTLRIRISDAVTGRVKTNVSVPASLVDTIVAAVGRFAPGIEGDQAQLLLAALRDGQVGKILDVVDEADGERVEIFIE
jgi:hypothetical protein